MVRLTRMILFIALLTFSFPLLDAQAKGGGKGGGGMGKDSGSMMNSGSGMGGNMNQPGKGNGQRVRDGSCENNKGQPKGPGRQNMNENNKMRRNGKAGNNSQQ